MDVETLVIAFPNFKTARKAIEQLENGGLEGTTMEFAEEDRQAANTADASTEQDGRMMGRTFRNLTAAAVIGLFAGALVGFLAGMAMFPNGPAAGVVAMAIGAAAAGTGVGVAVGGIARHKQSEAWADTFAAPDTAATLRVTVATPEERSLVVAVARDVGGEIAH